MKKWRVWNENYKYQLANKFAEMPFYFLDNNRGYTYIDGTTIIGLNSDYRHYTVLLSPVLAAFYGVNLESYER